MRRYLAATALVLLPFAAHAVPGRPFTCKLASSDGGIKAEVQSTKIQNLGYRLDNRVAYDFTYRGRSYYFSAQAYQGQKEISLVATTGPDAYTYEFEGSGFDNLVLNLGAEPSIAFSCAFD